LTNNEMHTLPRWALWIVGLTLLSLATGAACIGLLINVEYARPSGWLMVAAFGFAEVGEWLIPLVCGAIGWTRFMRLSLFVCAFTSVWCIANHLADLQAGSILGMEHSSRQYSGATADADRARATLARITETGAVVDLERLADAAKAEMDRQEANGGRGKRWAAAQIEYKGALSHLSAARERDAAKAELSQARTRAESGPAQAPGAALILSAVSGSDVNETARGLSMVRTILGVLLVKVVTYWTLPAVALLRLAARRPALGQCAGDSVPQRGNQPGTVSREGTETVPDDDGDGPSGGGQSIETNERDTVPAAEGQCPRRLSPPVLSIVPAVPRDEFAEQVRAYSRAGFSVRQIAQKMGCGKNRVQNILKPKNSQDATAGEFEQ
jgi:hypothetical protein